MCGRAPFGRGGPSALSPLTFRIVPPGDACFRGGAMQVEVDVLAAVEVSVAEWAKPMSKSC